MEALDVLAAFGATGRVGLLHPRARLREVVTAYGMPWDIGRIDKRRRWPHLYSYGDVEFVTDDGPDPVLHVASTWAHEHDCMPAAAVDAAFADDFPPERTD